MEDEDTDPGYEPVDDKSKYEAKVLPEDEEFLHTNYESSQYYSDDEDNASNNPPSSCTWG